MQSTKNNTHCYIMINMLFWVLVDVTVAAFKVFLCTVTEENRGVWLKKGVTQR